MSDNEQAVAGAAQQPARDVGDDEVSAMGVSFKTMVGAGKDASELAMSTYVPYDLDEGKLNAFLDKINRVLQRQRTIGEIPHLEDNIQVCRESIKNITEEVARLDAQHQKAWETSGKRGSVQLDKTQAANRENTLVNLAKWQEDLEKYTMQLRKAEALIGGAVEQEEAVEKAA